MREDYQSGLSPGALVDKLGELFHAQRRIERLICRYLADLADRLDAGCSDLELSGFADVYQAARCLFGLGVRSTRERVRVGRALRDLQGIEEALVEGRLGYSRAREVTRVARPEDEQQWLELARALPMRDLERRVVAAGERAKNGGSSSNEPSVSGDTDHIERGSRKEDEPAYPRWITPKTIRLEMTLPAEAWALLKRAIEGARRQSEAPLTEADALEAIARDALARQGEGADASDPRRAVVLYECRNCRRAEVETGAGAVELEAAEAAALGCGAAARDLAREGRVVARGGPMPASVRRAVLLRDRCRCRVPGCSRRRYVDVHHLDARARGGAHSRNNCITLCTTHHRMLHAGEIRVEGDADGDGVLLFSHADGEPLVDSLEAALHDSGNAVRGPKALAHPSEALVDCTDTPGSDRIATQLGSPGNEAQHRGRTRAPGAMDSESPMDADAELLLEVMGNRGGWDANMLSVKSGLSAARVSAALTTLELDRRIRRDLFLFRAA